MSLKTAAKCGDLKTVEKLVKENEYSITKLYKAYKKAKKYNHKEVVDFLDDLIADEFHDMMLESRPLHTLYLESVKSRFCNIEVKLVEALKNYLGIPNLPDNLKTKPRLEQLVESWFKYDRENNKFLHELVGEHLMDRIIRKALDLPETEEDQEHFFHNACLQGDSKEISRLADKRPDLLNNEATLNGIFEDPDHVDIDVVELLLQKGADPLTIAKQTTYQHDILELCFKYVKNINTNTKKEFVMWIHIDAKGENIFLIPVSFFTEQKTFSDDENNETRTLPADIKKWDPFMDYEIWLNCFSDKNSGCIEINSEFFSTEKYTIVDTVITRD